MNLYSYEGPIHLNKKCIEENWKGYTYANSEKKARANLVYQFKKKNGYGIRSHLYLLGKVRLIERNVHSKLYDGEQMEIDISKYV